MVKEITETGADGVHEPSSVPLENLKDDTAAKGFWPDFRYFLIVMILISAIIALLLPMIRLQLLILEKIKAVSDLTKRLYGSIKTDGEGKSIQLKLIKVRN